MGDTRKIRRRQRCPKCGSLDIIKWGVRGSVQRYNANRRKADLSKPEEPPLRMLFILAQDDRTGGLTLDITALDPIDTASNDTSCSPLFRSALMR